MKDKFGRALLHIPGPLVEKLLEKAAQKSRDADIFIDWQTVARDILSKGVSE